MTASTTAGRPMVEGALFLLALVHLAWTGAIAGSSTAAVAIDFLGGPRFRAVASAIARAVRADLVAVAWLEVTAAGILILARVRHPFIPQSVAFWGAVLVALVAGLTALGLFRSLLDEGRHAPLRLVSGLAGIGLVVFSTGLLCLGSGALLQPEQWATNEPGWRLLLTWSGTARFAELTFVSLAWVGAIVAALGERAGATPDGRFARRFGNRATLVFLLAWPPALLFTHVNLPAIALAPGVWAFAAAGLLLAAAAVWIATPRLSGEPAGKSRALLLLPVATLGAVVAGEQVARDAALRDVVLAGLEIPSPAAAPPPRAPPPAAPAGARIAEGKAVFDRVCHLCHRFDVKLIGPPFNSVVPKYRKDPEALKAFIRNPTKKDPAFPPMPKPAVTPAEIDAVAAYLLETAAR